MKKLLFLLAFIGSCFAQQPSIQWRGTLTASCANATTACTTTGSSVENTIGFNQTGFNQDLSGFGVATITVSGTYAGVTINFEFSDDGGTTWFQDICTRTDANIQESSEVLPSNQVRAWDCGLSGPIKLRARASAISSGTVNVGVTATVSSIEPAPTVAIANTPGQTDPCQNPGVLKSSAVINVSTATTTQLVALVAGQKVYVCGGFFDVGASGTSAAAATLEYGTGSSCGTGTTVLTGAMGTENTTATNGPLAVIIPGGSTQMTTAAGNALCILTAGTTVAVHGYISFVQQ